MTNDRMTNDEGMTKRETANSFPSSFVIRHSSLRRPGARSFEAVTFWLFRLATYLVIAAATYIFLDIGVKGGRAVFTRTAPFINLSFLSEPPQTLYVFDFE